MEELQYPFGRFKAKALYTESDITNCIQEIEQLPARLKEEVEALNNKQLDTPYRDGGWTVRQLVHHIADSHTNAYIRTKWALTEDQPLIKAYDEKGWATTPETVEPIDISLDTLQALHRKWTCVLSKLDDAQRRRQFIHPESGKAISIAMLIQNYAWHGNHHLAHIIALKKRMNW